MKFWALLIAALVILFAVGVFPACTESKQTPVAPRAMALMRTGRFSEARELLDASRPEAPETAYLLALCGLALGEKPSLAGLAALHSREKETALSAWALSDPSGLLASLHSQARLDEPEKRAAWLALAATVARQDDLLAQERTWLYPPSRNEETMKGLATPNARHPLAQFREETKVFVTTTQRLRRELDAELEGKPLAIRLRILDADRKLESRAGEFLRHAPPPPRMKGKALSDYRQGLARIGQVFVDRAKELAKRTDLLRGEASSVLPDLPDLNRWPWPSGSEPIVRVLARKNYAAALVWVDLLREDVLKDDRAYYSALAGVLLSASGAEPMRVRAMQILLDAKQDELIERWRGLTATTVGSPGTESVRTPRSSKARASGRSSIR